MPDLSEVLTSLVGLISGRIRVVQLRSQIRDHKARDYDRVASNVVGLRRALDTQERVVEDLHEQLADKDTHIQKLRNEYNDLKSKGAADATELKKSERLAWFKHMQSALTQLPTIRAAVVQEGADIPARDVLDIVAPLETSLSEMGFEKIGEAGSIVQFDPKRHKAVGRGARDIAPDDDVRVRYVGYLHEGEVLTKAEVTRIEQPETV